MKAGCLTESILEISEEESCVHSHGVVKCIWYNDRRFCRLVDTIIYQVV